MQFTDRLTLDGVRTTKDGYLVADAKVGRTGIQTYSGREVGKPELAKVRVYRPEAEVFHQDAMASAAFRPVTNDHPTVMVDATNWREHAVGMTGGDIVRDGGFIRVPLTVMDAAAIRDVQAGKRELSLGYTCDLEFADGVTPEGEAYDAIQKSIRINHLAICSAARGGPELRIGDEQELNDKGGRPVATKIITFDGLPVETTDAAEAVINKLKGLLDTSAKALETATKDHTAAIATKDAELATKDAKLTELEGKIVTDAALDALVADRAAIVTKARAIDPKVVIDGKSNAEIKRAVLGDAVKDKSDAYVDAAFDLKVADTKADPLREVIIDGVKVEDAEKAVTDARTAMIAELRGEKAAA